jgi:hypothetical protein
VSDPITWGDYVGFDPGVDRPLDEVTRAEAREYFDRFIRATRERPDVLRGFLAVNGVTLEPEEAALDQLNAFYVDHVTGDPLRERLDPQWYVVARDIGIWVGNFLIARADHLEWRLFTGGKTDVAYQRPVIMGFDVPNKKYNVDPELDVVGLGVRAVQGEPDYEYLRSWVAHALAFA